MNRLELLEQSAADMGITLITHTGGEAGRWYSTHRAISLRMGLHPVAQMCTLAHEVSHAALGHDSMATGWVHARQERQAVEHAAMSLITVEAYAQAERLYGPHLPAIAAELEVTVELLKTWIRVYQTRGLP